MDALELATAYVTLAPSMQGAAGLIGQQLGAPDVQAAVGKAGDKAGKTWQGKFGKAGKNMTLGAVGALVAVGAAGLKAGMDVDEAYDTIRAGTGATGKRLEGLQATFRNVAKKVPADMATVGKTVSDLNQRLGVTGPTLDKLSRQILEAGRLGGVDVNVQKITGAFSAFGVQGKDTTREMDNIFRVSQATGVGINDLAATMAKSGGVLKQLGFDFTESASLIGTFDKAGINSRAVVSSMQAGLVKLAKDGEKPAEAFKRVSGELQGFVKSGDDAAALELASKVFGTRGAGQFVAALKSGKVNLDDLAGSAKLSKDTILGVAQETKDFPELWAEFKNSATLALAPVGERLMPMIGDALVFAAPLLERFVNGLAGMDGGQLKILGGIAAALLIVGPVLWGVSKAQAAWTVATTAWTAITRPAVALQKAATAAALGTRLQLAALAVQQRLSAVATVVWTNASKFAAIATRGLGVAIRFAMGPIGLIITAIGLVVGALVWFFTETEVGQRIVKAAWSGIKAAISAVSGWWTGTAWPAIRAAITSMGQFLVGLKDGAVAAWNGIRNGINTAWQWIDKNVFAKVRFGIAAVRLGFYLAGVGIGIIWSTIRSNLSAGWKWIDQNVFARFRNGIKAIQNAFSSAKDGIKSIWNGLKKIAADPVNFVINTVYMNGIRSFVGKIFDFFGKKNPLPSIAPVKFADGSEDHRAQIARGGAMRLWAEPETGGEAYIPLAASKRGRSTAILSKVAQKFGYSLNAYAGGGFFGEAADFLRGPVDYVKRGASNAINGAFGGRAGGVWDMMRQFPKMLVGPLADYAKNKIASVFGGGGPGAPAGKLGWRKQWEIVQGMFPGARLHSAFRPGAVTAVGTPSYHGLGRAIDVNPSMTLFNRLSSAFPNSTELIFSPANGRQIHNGRRTTFGEPTRGDHWDHIHWAMANGGILPSVYDDGGWMLPGQAGVNLGNRPEAVLDPDESAALKAGLNQRAPLVGTMIVRDEWTAVREMEAMERRSATRAGLGRARG
jgi:TP901 family phage tail tape measure protein